MDYIFTETFCRPDGEGEFTYEDFYSLCFKEEWKGASATEKFLFSVAKYFISALLESTGLELERENVKPEFEKGEIDRLSSEVPFSIGSRFVDRSWVKRQLSALLDVYRREISAYPSSVDLYFNEKNSLLSMPSRIYFHLVANPKGELPFAFMATYTTKDPQGCVHHYPLRYALSEYADDLEAFSSLIAPVSQASRESEVVRWLLESGELFSPVGFTAAEAYDFLKEAEALENAGIVCRIPDFWKKRGKNSAVSVSVSGRVRVGLDAIISIKPSLVYEGVKLSKKEIEELLSQSEGLAFLKGKWVELDHQKLEKLLKSAAMLTQDTSIADLIAYSSGVKELPVKVVFPEVNWLSDVLEDVSGDIQLPESLNAVLRPYQLDGYRYLFGMKALGFGLCLADDMGLGKTVQVLAFLEKLRENEKVRKVLLIVPSSLIGNWQSEILKFTPSLDFSIYHGSERQVRDSFLTITTYALAARDVLISAIEWDEVILDEAQYIKNPGTKVSTQIRSYAKGQGVILTGTPVENNLMNLWSLMEFINPGFLGTKSAFTKFAKEPGSDGITQLRSAISPFILRRLKSDKRIISDLPDKVENDLQVNLSKQQIALYRQVVKETEELAEQSNDEKEVRGLVLATIMKLKEICNHPDQFNGGGAFKSTESGKFELLKELATTIHENREKVLVFTQFAELIPHLDDLLCEVFCERGLVIDGSVSARKRTEIVKQFQNTRTPYMVLSLRAAGVGLNLTSARNVIHFDRWWNPAVENQATDRAYRIGQKHKVMVYKFITRDTIEERIDEMIKEKQELADSLFSDLSSDIFSKLSVKEILSAMEFTGGER